MTPATHIADATISTTPRPTRLATLVATDGSEAAQRGIRVAAALEAATPT